MNLPRSITLLALCLVWLAPISMAAAAPADESKTGIAVGEKAPDFTLRDQNGDEQSLSGLLEGGPVALFFTRSAEWWPFCIGQLVQLQEDQEKLEAAGLRTVSLSYDDVRTLKRFADERGITYTMLSDEGSKTIDAYGIRNTEAPAGTRYDGIPYPGTFLIGADGVIKGKLFLAGYVERHDNDALIQMAEDVLE